MSPKNAAIWTAVVAERRALIADLRGLTPEQWQAPTACGGWDVHDVLAHLVDTARTTKSGFIRDMVVSRFDFDRANQRGVDRARGETPAQTLASFQSAVARTSGPPAPLATRLVEAFVHGEDIRRAVGLTGDYPTAQVLAALELQLRTTTKFGGGKEHVEGLRLIADDADWSTGAGPELSGTALALLLAVSGRSVRPDELSGPGAATLRERARS